MGESDEAPIPMLVAYGRLVLRIDAENVDARLVQASTRTPRHSCASGVLPTAPLSRRMTGAVALLTEVAGGWPNR